MKPPTLIILTAVALEAKAVAGALGIPCPAPRLPVSRPLGGRLISIHVVGIGARNLGGLPVEGVSCVIMAGLAGALDPALEVGDVIVGEMPVEWRLPSGARAGRIFSSDRIVATPREKAELFATTGAMAVEMENERVQEWARRQGAAFVAIRAISDRADQSLDPRVLRLVDELGRPKWGAVVKTLIRRPSLIPMLIRVGADSKKATHHLGLAVKQFVTDYTKREADG